MGDKDSTVSIFRMRLGYLVKFVGRFVHFGFVPLVLYLGISLGQTDPNMPELSARNLLW